MENLKDDVEHALEKIREGLRVDGGDVQLVDIVDGIVKVKLQGHCAGERAHEERNGRKRRDFRLSIALNFSRAN
jgi:hypothetical protein